MKHRSPSTGKWHLFLAALGVLCALVGVAQAVLAIAFYSQAQETEAQVVGVGRSRGATARSDTSFGTSRSVRLSAPASTVQFETIDGQTVEASIPGSHEKGTTVSIHYYPSNPSWVEDDTYLERFAWILGWLLLGAGLLSPYAIRRLRR